ncbi:MAG: rRNA pseudouridine synthase [Alphaproteobacteria bacterium]|nr:MAG: rRNA pseudouridine synthase [Alphaproteobacteria bacterium]
MRLNVYLQRAGVGSRREAERMVEAGRVTVDGVTASVTTAVEDGNMVCVDGAPVGVETAPMPRIFKYHKPVGVIVTARDHEGRKTLYDAIAEIKGSEKLPRLMPVGRLDLNSEGLLLLTTDGGLAQTLMSPKTALRREYHVRVFGELSEIQVAQFRKGVTVEGVWYRGAEVELLKIGESQRNRWYKVILTEGKNREIRRIFNYFNCEVNRLLRVQYGPYTLDDMPKGTLVEVPQHEVETLVKELAHG